VQDQVLEDHQQETLNEFFNKNNDMINKQPISKETINNPIFYS
jgi:hypothetical protein